MVIDIHTHPYFLQPIAADPQRQAWKKETMGFPKVGDYPMTQIRLQMECAGIDCAALLPLDLTATEGDSPATNEEVASLVQDDPQRFIGFASIQPQRVDAKEALLHAFDVLCLSGLKLHPGKQGFSPDDPTVYPLYEICQDRNKPVIFSTGMTWEPGATAAAGHPMRLEPVLHDFPKMRLCLAHFGWPWVQETAMLLLRYPNAYADTALLHFDSAPEFYHKVFFQDLGIHWIDRSLRHQVMFGSGKPRFEQIRMKQALEGMPWRASTIDMVLGENALTFLGQEVAK